MWTMMPFTGCFPNKMHNVISGFVLRTPYASAVYAWHCSSLPPPCSHYKPVQAISSPDPSWRYTDMQPPVLLMRILSSLFWVLTAAFTSCSSYSTRPGVYGIVFPENLTTIRGNGIPIDLVLSSFISAGKQIQTTGNNQRHGDDGWRWRYQDRKGESQKARQRQRHTRNAQGDLFEKRPGLGHSQRPTRPEDPKNIQSKPQVALSGVPGSCLFCACLVSTRAARRSPQLV